MTFDKETLNDEMVQSDYRNLNESKLSSILITNNSCSSKCEAKCAGQISQMNHLSSINQVEAPHASAVIKRRSRNKFNLALPTIKALNTLQSTGTCFN